MSPGIITGMANRAGVEAAMGTPALELFSRRVGGGAGCTRSANLGCSGAGVFVYRPDLRVLSAQVGYELGQ